MQHDRTQSPEWLSAREAGDLLGVHSRTVGRWIRDGRLPGRMTVGGQFRVTREDVERLAAEMERKAQKPAQTRSRRKEDRTPPKS